MKNNKKTSAFTLVEMLLSLSLVVVLGLVVYACLNGGLRIWHRANTSYVGEDVNVFFEKLAVDMRNSFPYKDIEFIGTPEGFQFASIIATDSQNPGLQRGVGEVLYTYDQDSKSISRKKRNLSKIFKEKQGTSQEVMTGVAQARFQYYYYDPRAKEYFWVDEWGEGSGIPLAVAVKLDVDYGGKTHEFSKTVTIPVR